MTMELIVVAPMESKKYTIKWLEVETLSGNLVILPGYAPSYIVIRPNTFVRWALQDERTESVEIEKALLQVERDKAILIVS